MPISQYTMGIWLKLSCLAESWMDVACSCVLWGLSMVDYKCLTMMVHESFILCWNPRWGTCSFVFILPFPKLLIRVGAVLRPDWSFLWMSRLKTFCAIHALWHGALYPTWRYMQEVTVAPRPIGVHKVIFNWKLKLEKHTKKRTKSKK